MFKTNDIVSLRFVKIAMLPDKAKFVVCSIISLAPSFWTKHLVIGQSQKPAKFSAFHWSTSRNQAFIGHLCGTSRESSDYIACNDRNAFLHLMPSEIIIYGLGRKCVKRSPFS